MNNQIISINDVDDGEKLILGADTTDRLKDAAEGKTLVEELNEASDLQQDHGTTTPRHATTWV